MPKEATELAQLISKHDAARMLKISVSALDRLLKKRGIQKHYQSREGGGSEAFLSRSNIETLARERASGIAPDPAMGLAIVKSQAAAVVNGVQIDAARSLADYLNKLAEHLTALTTSSQEGPKDFLTLEEASRRSGLPQPYIANLLRTDQVDHIGRGPVTWRIRRESLAEYGKAKL